MIVDVNYEQINKLLETSGINLKFVLENVCDKPKLQSTETVIISTYSGQPDEGQNEQQQLQQEITFPTMQKQSVA